MRHRPNCLTARPLLPGVRSDIPLEELRARYARCDIAVVDLDECLMPGFAQVVLGRRILFRTALWPRRFGDLLRIPALMKGGLFVTAMRTLEFIGFEMSRPRMMFVFERAMRGLARSYFDDAVDRIPASCYPMARETITFLSKKMPVGIISFCLELIVREFVSSFNSGRDRIVSFYDSNALEFKTDGEREILQGYARSRFMTTKEDKRRALEDRLKGYSASCPLVIGHSDEDVGMAELARERGGIAIGFKPLRSCKHEFSVVVEGCDWSPVENLCRLLAGERANP